MQALERLPPATLRRVYWCVLAGTFGGMLLLQYLAQGFQHKENPEGESFNIVQLEFAHTPERVETIKETWGKDGIRAAIRQTCVDYLWLLFYSLAIALGALAVVSGEPPGSRWRISGRIVAGLQPIAALLDATENTAMLVSLYAPATSPYPQIAYYCAAVKFLFVVVGILFVLVALPLRFTDRD